ncbi:MAG: thiolase family protein [bacterium]|nr:thiolase family protein [bacterium]
MERIGIVGVGMTPISSGKKEVFYDASFEAARRALADARLDRGDLDQVVAAGYDLACGRTITNMYTTPAAGGYLKDETRISDDGMFALAQAWMRMGAGFATTMCLAYGVSSEAPMPLVSNLMFEPLFHRPFGMHSGNTAALQASVYCAESRTKPEDAALVVVKNLRQGSKNPRSRRVKPVTAKQVEKSPMAAWPLRELDLPNYSDGTVGLILAPEHEAKRISPCPVWIEGIGWSIDSYYLGERNLAELKSLSEAARRAYLMAGIKDPAREIQVFEVAEQSSYYEIMAYEALGLISPGGGAKLIRSGATEISGRIPVNPSGGAMASDPVAATGLFRVAEAVLQLQGRAGKVQVKGAQCALASVSSGPAGQASCVVILRRD